ncbi:hypothetical protein A8F94_01725 [Bacillus sp. FJAT-27225]|uniref:hypothetical protein n=1 Tax=Bacillus sp. FJAT-27225 TaxID=1743144 RepID=UPI00080C2936|nr:hypothetical protein [Bacillus sp. FJAT-27225]OCA90623.1 hypothetical protein A8F94_01725 [Bacillus sp. FJAT-27225]
MGTCKLDHSPEDVQKKYETQCHLLPSNIREPFADWLSSHPTQLELNEVFHLLKKYDLITEEEQAARDLELSRILLDKGEKGK